MLLLTYKPLIMPLNLPAVAGWSQLCYAGRCVSKTSPPASLEAQRTRRRFSFFIAAERAAMKNHSAAEAAAAKAHNKQL